MAAGAFRVRRVLRGAVAAAACVALSGCWLAPGGGPSRNGHNGVETTIGLATAPGLTEAWSRTDVGGSWGPPTIFGSRVFISNFGVRALDVDTGASLWVSADQVPIARTFVHGSDLLVVLLGSPWGGIGTHRVAQATGTDVGNGPIELMSLRGSTAVSLHGPSRGDPVVHTDIVVRDIDNPATGVRIVTLVGQGPVMAPTTSAERVVVSGSGLLTTDPTDSTVGLGLRAYDLDTAPAPCATNSSGEYPITYGCPLWVLPLDGTQTTAPVVTDDGSTVVVGTDTGAVYAVDEATGAVRWTASVGSAVTANVGIADDTVLVPTAGNGVVALPLAGCDAPTCAPTWSSTLPDVDVQPVSAGGAVFVGHADGVVAAYPVAGCGAELCAPVWSTDVGTAIATDMAIGSGHLIVEADGILHAFAPAPG